MKIQTKLVLLVAIVSLGFIVVAALSLTTLGEMGRLSQGLRDGHSLIGKVWKLQSATQQLMLTEDLASAYTAWKDANVELLESKRAFFSNDAVLQWAERQGASRQHENAISFFEEVDRHIEEFRADYEEVQARDDAITGGFYREVFVERNMQYLFLNNRAQSLITYLGDTTEGVVVRLVEHLDAGYDTLSGRMTAFYLAVTIGIVLAISAFILVFTRSIRRRFAGIEAAMLELADGDFTQPLEVKGKDELAAVSRNINTFIAQFSDIIRKIKQTSDQTIVLRDELEASTDESARAVGNIAESIATISREAEHLKETIEASTNAAGDISASVDRLAEQIENQSSAVAESSSSIEEMTASIRNVARVAASKQESTDKLVAVTRTGGEKVEATNAIVEEITDSANAMMEIIGIINKIASQTNMLSMNAAIEAAHAGDAGRGFSVVAEEIRNLSESTNTNAKKIRESLQQIRGRADDARALSQESRTYFQQISGEVDGVTEALREIASTMDELSVGTGEILTSTNELTTTTSVIGDTSGAIKERTDRIDASLQEVRAFAEQLAASVESVEQAAGEITSAIEKVGHVSRRNSENISELSSAVNQFAIDDSAAGATGAAGAPEEGESNGPTDGAGDDEAIDAASTDKIDDFEPADDEHAPRESIETVTQ